MAQELYCSDINTLLQQDDDELQMNNNNNSNNNSHNNSNNNNSNNNSNNNTNFSTKYLNKHNITLLILFILYTNPVLVSILMHYMPFLFEGVRYNFIGSVVFGSLFTLIFVLLNKQKNNE